MLSHKVIYFSLNSCPKGTDGKLFGAPTVFADAVSPASDDATGAVGTTAEAAREDHKHPAQGVSVDADNSLTIGTDGLHFFTDVDEVVENAGPLTGAAPAGPRSRLRWKASSSWLW